MQVRERRMHTRVIPRAPQNKHHRSDAASDAGRNFGFSSVSMATVIMPRKDLLPPSSSNCQVELVSGRAVISTVSLIRGLGDVIGMTSQQRALSTISGAIEAEATGVCVDLTERIALLSTWSRRRRETIPSCMGWIILKQYAFSMKSIVVIDLIMSPPGHYYCHLFKIQRLHTQYDTLRTTLTGRPPHTRQLIHTRQVLHALHVHRALYTLTLLFTHRRVSIRPCITTHGSLNVFTMGMTPLDGPLKPTNSMAMFTAISATDLMQMNSHQTSMQWSSPTLG
jgi:hypothetical protein